MRIIAGDWRGRSIRAPRGRDTRPTPDRVREALFGILGPAVGRGRVLDLFSGTGALGLEALSRGAPEAVFVERSRGALAALRANLEDLGAGDRARVLARSALTLKPEDLGDPPFTLILADPPYAMVERDPDRRRLVALLERLSDALAPDGLLVVEHRRSARLPGLAGLVETDRREYGDTALTFLTPASTPPGAGNPAETAPEGQSGTDTPPFPLNPHAPRADRESTRRSPGGAMPGANEERHLLYFASGENESNGRERLERIIELLSQTPDVRSDLVEEIQEQIDQGEYLTEAKLNFAIYRMLKDILD
jgi:16S rRNA (guanine966-N2)-methyltransferase